jgi:hypothetical protein
VPASVLVPIGLALIAWAVAVWVIGSRADVNRQAVWAVVALNVAWVAASLLVVAAGALPLTGLGIAFVLLQAAAVALFAELQVVGLRRALPRGA